MLLVAGAVGVSWRTELGRVPALQPSVLEPGGGLRENPEEVERFSPSAETEALNHTHRYIAIIATGALRADLEPCGCTTPPSGGISRAVPLIDRAVRETSSSLKTLVVNSGDSLADASNPLLRSHPELIQAKAAVVRRFLDRISLDFMALGEEDLVLDLGDPDAFPPASNLVASNVVSKNRPVSPVGIVRVDGTSILFQSFLEEELFRRKGLSARGFLWREPERVLQEGPAQSEPVLLRIIALHGSDPDKAGRLLRAAAGPGPVVLLENVHLGASGKDWALMEDSLRLMPSLYGRSVYVANLFLNKSPSKQWRNLSTLKGLSRAAALIRSKQGSDRNDLERQLRTLEEQSLEELARLRKCNAFEVRTVPITDSLEEDAQARLWIEDYSRKSRESLGTSDGFPLRYRGEKQCGECHRAQWENWRPTRHASAFESLLARKETRNPNCVVCHSTGYGSPGGIRQIDDLESYRNVQCEACHVPTEVPHPGAPKASFRVVTPSTCLGCHTARQDPQFDYSVYRSKGTCVNALLPGESRVRRGEGPRNPH